MATALEDRGPQGPLRDQADRPLVADTEETDTQLKRAVGLLDLTALGIGAIIGTGIFVILGEAIGDAGPAIILSFVLAGVTCAFSALSYAELASSIPVSGSAYTYRYATLGELVAWIIGWDLILEYGVSVAGGRRRLGPVLQRAARHAVRLLAARRRSPTRPGRTAARSTCRPSSSCSPSPPC